MCIRDSKIADGLTPLAKGLGSEYCNQNAYDCIQIHGGSGFMKDYACERIYRDARITSIYEGTTQLQVVAAIRHVLSGTYATLIEAYAAEETKAELQGVKDVLANMAEKFIAAVAAVKEVNVQEYTDFMARRLVEMGGFTIMGYLLLSDANRNEGFVKSLNVYVKLIQAEIDKHADFIANFKPEQLEYYKY